MSQLLQEFVDSGSQPLRVDRTAGVIRGVKLLGLRSRNGRRYREDALREAIGLYEGAKVNVNHPKGHPLAPRDYQDRLGEIRGARFRASEGLFGDLHFNPRHALSEQLIWDAEHAPQNVGLSHNVLARTARDGDDTVVEAITKVQSIDLVADPATTAGLYEHAGVSESGRAVEQKSGSGSSAALPLCRTAALDSSAPVATFDALTVEQLQLHRPDLVDELQRAHAAELSEARQQLDAATAREVATERRAQIVELLQEHGLPLPTSDHAADRRIVSEEFVRSLMSASDESAMRQLVEERAALVQAASRLNGPHQAKSRPRSRDQSAFGPIRTQTAAEFATAIRAR